jgi:hypothetical protein
MPKEPKVLLIATITMQRDSQRVYHAVMAEHGPQEVQDAV